MEIRFISLVFQVVIILTLASGNVVQAAGGGGGRLLNSFWTRTVSAWMTSLDMRKFLFDAHQKMGHVSCTTVIFDDMFGNVIDAVAYCHPALPSLCSNNFVIYYNGTASLTKGTNATSSSSSIMSMSMVAALKAGRAQQCGAYVILMKNSTKVSQLLHLGDQAKLINTHAKFLIWYGDLSPSFARDDIWKKIPNVVLFHSRTRGVSKGLTVTILGLKWPIVPNVKDPTRIIEFWRQGHLSRDEDWYTDKTSDLKRSELRVVVVDHPPGVIKITSQLNGSVIYAGTEVEILKELSYKMNFVYSLVSDVDKGQGATTMSVHTDNGMSGGGGMMSPAFVPDAFKKLMNGEAEMGIGTFLILSDYLEHVDMSVPLDVACTSFLTPNPLPRPRSWVLLMPFDVGLWLLVIFICMILVPGQMYWMTTLAPLRTEYSCYKGRSGVVVTSICIVTQVSMDLWPKFWSLRWFVCSYWMFSFLLTSAYKGAMVSFLTIPFYEDPIDTLEDLVHSGLGFGGWGTELQKLFTQQGDAGLHAKYRVLSNVDTGISDVADGKFALFENTRYLRFIRQTRNLTKVGAPSMRLMKECVIPVRIGIAYQRNSPFVATINKQIRRFQESGLLKRWSQKLVSLTRQHNKNITVNACDDKKKRDNEDDSGGGRKKRNDEDADSDGNEALSQDQEEKILSIKDLQSSFYFLLFGLLLAALALAGEIIRFRSEEIKRSVNQARFDLECAHSPQFAFLTGQTLVKEERGPWWWTMILHRCYCRRIRDKNRDKIPPPFPYPYLE